jgi:hypothetical protein
MMNPLTASATHLPQKSGLNREEKEKERPGAVAALHILLLTFPKSRSLPRVCSSRIPQRQSVRTRAGEKTAPIAVASNNLSAASTETHMDPS